MGALLSLGAKDGVFEPAPEVGQVGLNQQKLNGEEDDARGPCAMNTADVLRPLSSTGSVVGKVELVEGMISF